MTLPVLPDRLKPKMTTAMEVAVLVQCLPLERGAALIEQYAQTVASAASLDAAIDMRDRILVGIEGGIPRHV
jgi:hypothetical protein